MNLTPEQRTALSHGRNTLLVACPGSGKTRTVIAKLLKCIDEIRDTPRRVACITYTNSAVHEIEDRIRVYGSTGDEDLCDVSTIHSFCQNNILRHFHWRLEDYRDGYTVLPSDSENFLQFVNEVAEKYGLNSYARQQFEQLNRAPSGDPISKDIPPEAALDFWNRLRRAGYIDFCNLVYYSYRLLVDCPSIARSLGARFAHLLVDEFQDTSALQVEILTRIESQKLTTFFLVGDPEQSIYSFAGAERDLMFEFARTIGATEFPLTGNFRSSTPIIQSAESLITRNPPMFASGEASAFVERPFFYHAEDDFNAITEVFLPQIRALDIPHGEAAILAPTWFHLYPLGKKLREQGIPVVGPGARPYKRSHLFGRLAEPVCAYIVEPHASLVQKIERELFTILTNITGTADFRVFRFHGRRVVFRLVRAGEQLRDTVDSAIPWLNAAAPAFSSLLQEEDFLPANAAHLITESVDNMVQDIRDQSLDPSTLSLADLGMFAKPEKNLKLLTMHSAKSREYRAVGVISLHDGHVPYHNKYNPLTQAGEEEARRLVYVAMTRAKRFLMLSANSENWRPVSRFIKEIRFVP